jgi:hypothetical protein
MNRAAGRCGLNSGLSPRSKPGLFITEFWPCGNPPRPTFPSP